MLLDYFYRKKFKTEVSRITAVDKQEILSRCRKH